MSPFTFRILVILVAYGAAHAAVNDGKGAESATAPSSSVASNNPPESKPEDAPFAKIDRPDSADETTNPLLVKEEARSSIRLGQRAVDRRDFDTAELAYLGVMRSHAANPEKRDALIAIGRMYRTKGETAKAVAAFQKYFRDFPGDDEAPAVYLEFGRAARDLGSYKIALAQFYNVMNATLKVENDSFDEYRQLAKTAQFEIAETYFLYGDYMEASKFYARLRLVDLAPADRARAQYKSAYSLFLAEKYNDAVTSFKNYIENYPGTENEPECRYLLSVALRRLKRMNEAFVVTLELLKEARGGGDPQRLAYWQRKTGNQLANEFFEQGDFNTALSIYQSLAGLNKDPGWYAGALYQVGLCQERLQQTARARETYQTILDQLTAMKANGPLPANLVDIAQMVSWRRDQLDWRINTEAQLQPFLKNLSNTESISAVSPHDAHSSSSAAPTALR